MGSSKRNADSRRSGRSMLFKLAQRPQQFLRFCAVGAVNTGVDFTVFTILSSGGVQLLAAQTVSYTCGVLNSFLMNRTWTFKQGGRSHGQLSRFLAMNLFTLAVTYGLLLWFHNRWGWPLPVSKFVATGLSLVLNFTGSRRWVFI